MWKKRSWTGLMTVVGLGFLASLGLYTFSVWQTHSLSNSYLILNLLLATIPLLLSLRLVALLKHKRWSAFEPLLTTIVWIIFLPNSFYMISDFIHLQNMSSSTILYNAVMFSAFIYLAVLLGMISLYQVHQALRKRVYPSTAALMVALIILGCCFAIYLGRDLRWNSWDVVINPGGLLFDISNLILRPGTYPGMIKTIASFFIVIGTAYAIAWQSSRLLWHSGVNDLAAHIKRRQNN